LQDRDEALAALTGAVTLARGIGLPGRVWATGEPIWWHPASEAASMARARHHRGRAMLITIAARLRGHVRGGDTVARLGGDEFVVILLAPSISARRFWLPSG
jgi:hypothetical protein